MFALYVYIMNSNLYCTSQADILRKLKKRFNLIVIKTRVAEFSLVIGNENFSFESYTLHSTWELVLGVHDRTYPNLVWWCTYACWLWMQGSSKDSQTPHSMRGQQWHHRRVSAAPLRFIFLSTWALSSESSWLGCLQTLYMKCPQYWGKIKSMYSALR